MPARHTITTGSPHNHLRGPFRSHISKQARDTNVNEATSCSDRRGPADWLPWGKQGHNAEPVSKGCDTSRGILRVKTDTFWSLIPCRSQPDLTGSLSWIQTPTQAQRKPKAASPHPCRRMPPSTGTTQTRGLGKGRGTKGQDGQELVVPPRLLTDLSPAPAPSPCQGANSAGMVTSCRDHLLPKVSMTRNQTFGKAQVPVPRDAQGCGTPH